MNQELPDDEILFVPSLWEQRCMLRLAMILDGVVAEFVIRAARKEATGRQASINDRWRTEVGGILFLLASLLRDTDTHSLEALAAQAGQVAFRRIREQGLDPLDKKQVLLHLEKEAKLAESRELQLGMKKVWDVNQEAPKKKARKEEAAKKKAKP
jgi:hypothetical protein